MKEPDNIKNIYFLGIGGIGMSALARFFHRSGKNVAGYDRTPTELTRRLSAEGIAVDYNEKADRIPEEYLSSLDTIVVLTPAVPNDHPQLDYFRKNHFTIYKRSEVLGTITAGYKTVAVAGTHGKTTVSTMIAYLMSQSEYGCNAFLGGISKNFNSNLVVNTKSSWAVTEADEFDRSFLRLHPYAAVVTAMDADHLDIYGNAESMRESFNLFISQIDRNGYLIMKKGLPVEAEVKPEKTFTYSLQDKSDFRAENIRLENSKYIFDLAGPFGKVENISLIHPGLVNVENAVAATATAVLLNLSKGRIPEWMKDFSGIKRRFDYQINTAEIVFIDDYAHHPQEIEATLRSVRDLYPGRKITGIFQPHLYTRTRDFSAGFAESLSLLDRLILLDIYPARELPIEGITSDIIFRKVNLRDKILCTKEDLPDLIKRTEIDILISLGAGDIDKLVEPVKQLLLKRMP